MPYHAVHTCMVDLLYEFYYGFSNDMSLKMLYRRRHRQFDMFGSAGIYDGHLRVRFCNLAWYKKQAGYNYWPWYVQTIFFFYTVNKNSLVMRFGLRLLEIFSKLACKSCFFFFFYPGADRVIICGLLFFDWKRNSWEFPRAETTLFPLYFAVGSLDVFACLQ